MQQLQRRRPLERPGDELLARAREAAKDLQGETTGLKPAA